MNYVLIDYENLQPKDLVLLNGHPFKVVVFMGANQTKVPVEHVKALQPLGGDVEYVQINGNGRNALDFHIAFHLGELAVRHPDGVFHVISKDTGFDPLLGHLRSKRIRARRSTDLVEVLVFADGRLDAVIEDLVRRGDAPPGRRDKLANTINHLFGKRLEEKEVDGLIEALESCGTIVVEEGKVTYRL
jgi:hypothetical protein